MKSEYIKLLGTVDEFIGLHAHMSVSAYLVHADWWMSWMWDSHHAWRVNIIKQRGRRDIQLLVSSVSPIFIGLYLVCMGCNLELSTTSTLSRLIQTWGTFDLVGSRIFVGNITPKGGHRTGKRYVLNMWQWIFTLASIYLSIWRCYQLHFGGVLLHQLRECAQRCGVHFWYFEKEVEDTT